MLAKGIVYVLLTAFTATLTRSQTVPEEYCERETFSPSCPDGEVIVVTQARYGRMRVGRCITNKYNLNCTMDALDLLDARCSGRKSCDVIVASFVPKQRQPCGDDLRGYLEASYECTAVITARREYCQSTRAIEIRQPSGYLASLVTAETSCGGFQSPWWITAKPGQTLRLTLYNFEPKTQLDRGGINPSCVVYVVINEDGYPNTETVCASSNRKSTVYASKTSKVEVRLVPVRQNAPEPEYFLVKFETIGCVNIPAPSNGWVQRFGNKAIMGCNETGAPAQWRLYCTDGEWTGRNHNCTAGKANIRKSVTGLGPLTTSHGLSILIILAIAGMVGICILIFGLFYLRRKRQSHTRAPPVVLQADYHDPYKSGEYPRQPGVSKSMDNLDSYQSTENDYYRTWQMQRHGQLQTMISEAPPVQPRPMPPSCLDPSQNRTGPGSASNSSIYDRQSKSCYSDHIYESPNFERKEFAPTGYKADGVPIEYYELVPDSPNGGK